MTLTTFLFRQAFQKNIFHFYVGGGSVTVMSKHRSCPLVPAKGMSRSAGHCFFFTNVKLHRLEDRWFRGLTKITYQLFFSVFRDIFYIMVQRYWAENACLFVRIFSGRSHKGGWMVFCLSSIHPLFGNYPATDRRPGPRSAESGIQTCSFLSVYPLSCHFHFNGSPF